MSRRATVRSGRRREDCRRPDAVRAALRADEAARDEMLRHADRCRSCRAAVLAAEPSALFRRLPVVELSGEEILEMRQRVTGVRRGRGVAELPARGPVAGGRGAWAAAAFVLFALTGLFTLQADWVGLTPGTTARDHLGAEQSSALSAEDEALLDEALSSRALLEGAEFFDQGQVVLMQVAAGGSDLAWVANDRLDL